MGRSERAPVIDRLLAIYPTASKVEDLLKRLSLRGPCLGHRLFTFPQLIDAIARSIGFKRPLLDAMAQQIVLDDAIMSSGGLPASLSAKTAGLVANLMRLVREFKAAALEPGDLTEAAQKLSGANAQRTAALAEVFGLYQWRLTAAGAADPHDREREVLRALLAAEASRTRPAFLSAIDRLLVAEVYDFGLQQFMITASLIRIIGDAELTLQAQPHQVDAARFADLTWNRFVEEESIAEMVLPSFVRRGGRPGRLGYVLEHLFEDPAAAAAAPEVPPQDDTIEIVIAPDRRREIEEVGREIRRALEADDAQRVAPDRIAVLARDPGPYAEYIETVFARYRIPVRLQTTRPLRASAAAKLAARILRCPLEEYPRRMLDDVASSPYLRMSAQRYRLALAECGYIDHATLPLTECLTRYRAQVSGDLLRTDDEDAQRRLTLKLERLAGARDAFAGLIETLETLRAPATLAEHVQRFERVLRELRFGAFASDRDGARGDAAWMRAAAQVAAALEGLSRAAQIAGVRRQISADEFADLFDEALVQTRIECADAGVGGVVRAMAVEDARGLDFDMVFIVGVADGFFPLNHGDDPILPDDLRMALNKPLAAAMRRRLGAAAPSRFGKILRTRYDRVSEDRFLFFLALSTAERRVMLSCASSDQPGSAALSSPFIDEVRRILGATTPERMIGAQQFLPRGEDCVSRAELLSDAAANSILATAAAVPELADAGRIESIRRRIAIERRRERYLALPARHENEGAPDADKIALADEFSGRVSASPRLREVLLGRGGEVRRWNAQRVSDLASCGFKFFAGQLLRLEDREEPDYEPSPLEKGSLAHQLLHRLLEAGIDFRDAAGARRHALRVFEEFRISTTGAPSDPAFAGLLWSGLKQIVNEMVEFEIEEHATGTAYCGKRELEHQFEFTIRDWREHSESRPHELVMHGRIDRLETDGSSDRITRLRVIDYKNSRSVKTHKDHLKEDRFGKTEFQLAVYMVAAIDELKARLAADTELRAGYLLLRSRDKLQADKFDASLFELDPERRKSAVSLADSILDTVGLALEGRFDVDPLDCSLFCPYRHVCRNFDQRTQAGET
jgi:ATP-dependent helicase/nuclease subunit B